MTGLQKVELEKLAVQALENAESIWNAVGAEMGKIAKSLHNSLSESVKSTIPGHSLVDFAQPKVDDFIAIVADMRNSTEHLREAIGQQPPKPSQLQRVFYETAVLLPCLAKTIENEDGRVTEYLGDGVLGLFQLDRNDKSTAIYDANRAARNCLEMVDVVINPLLSKRHNLPPLRLGVGMAYSRAVVTVVGLPGFMQPKAFGECVFYATKFSCGNNEIYVDKNLERIWPTVNSGASIHFAPIKVKDLDAFRLERKSP